MADFKTALEALKRGDVEISAVQDNVVKLLDAHPELSVQVMEQLREAYGEDLVDATTYARLKKCVTTAVEAFEPSAGGSERTVFASSGAGETDGADETQMLADDDSESIANICLQGANHD